MKRSWYTEDGVTKRKTVTSLTWVMWIGRRDTNEKREEPANRTSLGVPSKEVVQVQRRVYCGIVSS